MLPEGSRLGIGGVAGVEVVTEAEVEDGSPRRQRREEREKRLRGRGSSGVVAIEWREGAGAARCETEPRRLSRLLPACSPLPDDEASGRVSDDFDRGGLEMSTTERWVIERELDGKCRWWDSLRK